MEKKEIGIATIRYNEDGTVLSTSFKATMEVDISEEMLITLGNDIQSHAEMALASLFTQINNIEFADREHQEVVQQPYKCTYYDNGKIKKCEIKFYFKDVENGVIKLNQQENI